jgi:hypothetical protein
MDDWRAVREEDLSEVPEGLKTMTKIRREEG